MSDLKISEIQVSPIQPRNGLVAFSSFVLNNQLYIGSIAIYTSPSSPDGFRLVYPSKSLTNGTKLDIIYPINRETGLMIQRLIVKHYLKLTENLMKGNNENGQQSRST